MRASKYFWNCCACGAQNSREDGECQYCECQGADCKRDNCSGSRHPGLYDPALDANDGAL